MTFDESTSKRHATWVIALVIVAFAIYYAINKLYFNALQLQLRPLVASPLAAFTLAYVLVGLPLLLATALIHRRLNVFRDLGYAANPWLGLAFAAICTLPMFVGYGYMAGGLASGLTVTALIANNVLAGVFEETYFRGFLFGQLFRNTRLGFVPVIVLCSLLFALAHLHQSTDPIELLGILAITFMGSILFAWLYVEWNYNIWVPMCLHALMDVAWYLFATGPTALGGLGANLFRGLTIVLALVLTVAYKRRTGQPFVIRRSTLWQQAKPG